jgi:signal transduction histidine kinase
MALPSLLAAVVALGVVCTTSAAQTSSARTVLMIHWGPEAFPGTDVMDAAVRNGLSQSGVPIDYYAEYLETEEFTSDTASTALRDYIRRKFEGRRIDVVMANATAALQFALRYREELFPGAPIVFASVANPEVSPADRSAGVTGVVRDFAFGETLELAVSLHPTVRRVFVIAQAPTVKGHDELVQAALDRYTDHLELIYLKERTVPALITAVKAIPPDSVILYSRFSPIETDRVIYPDEIARLIAQAAPVPVYGVAEPHVGTGIVGGMMRDAEWTGTRLAKMVREIVAGTSPEQIPIGRGRTLPIFDWRQIERWGIDVTKLPSASRIRFRTPTLWEAYRGQVIGTIVLVAGLLVLIGGLLTQTARRRRAEETIRAREASLHVSYRRIRDLAGRLIHAQDAARASIAKDLHDDVCQRLASVSMSVDTLKRASGDLQSDAAQEAIAELARETHGAFDGIRRLSHELHPATLRVLGLQPALKAFCAEFAKRHDIEVTFTTEGDLTPVPTHVAICFFRIAQEALRNALVHGDARHLSVALSRDGAAVVMTITDDGRGFDLEVVRRDGGGLGLISMEERAHVIGGSVEIASAVQQGTTIRVRAPATRT